MAKLTDKFNVLIRSSVRGVFGSGSDQPPKLGKDAARQAEALRAEVNSALDDEDRISAEIAGLERQAAEWDQRADQALAQGDDAGARHAIRQMQGAQQQASFRRAELDQHRRYTADLISRVNTLEARLAQVQSQNQPSTAPDNRLKESIAGRLQRIQQSFESSERQPAASDDASAQMNEQTVEDDLARRRSRLSQ
ncbi:MAG TPA: PspA/IM30 family protein [Aggregatilinea sp.]|uniref:PspA/IM30 family protein n=1 Tax=Aggregatilinea sp. TaxID=2806333 RepID=UPI002CF20BA5|nr:PspA/IM30 family protein [Aggregatilinea sp.]HML21049.1 PspA/IM30 family protein [Aggregatilinea sp.]